MRLAVKAQVARVGVVGHGWFTEWDDENE